MPDELITEPDGHEVDTSSGKSQREQKNERVAREHEEERDLLVVLETTQGRRTIWRLVATASPLAEAFAAGQADMTAYTLGRQSWAKQMLNMLHSTPDLRRIWLQMQEEAEEHGW